MNPAYPPFTTHVTYQAGAPSGWRRFMGWGTRDPRIQQDLTPVVSVNKISSKPSKFGFLYKWKPKRAKVAPKTAQHDVGYFLTSGSYMTTNAPPPACVRAATPYPKPTTPKRHTAISSDPTTLPETSSRRSKRRSTNQYHHVPQSSSHAQTTPSPPPAHPHLSSSRQTPYRRHGSDPSAPKQTKKVRWADKETRKRSHSESHHQHQTHTHRASHHPIYDHGLTAYEPQYPTWQQYRQVNIPSQQTPPRQLSPHPSHPHYYSHPPDAQQVPHRFVIPPQRRKSVPYHLIPPQVAFPEQRP